MEVFEVEKGIAEMTGREKTAAAGAAVLALGITGYSVWKLIGTGILSWHAAQPEFHSMMAELAVVWLILFLAFFCDMRACDMRAADRHRGSSSFLPENCTWRSWGCAGVVALVFCWLHMIFLPIVFAVGYAGYLVLTGGWFRQTVMGVKRKNGAGSWLCWDFLLGCAVTIVEFCLLSLVNQGSIKKLRLWVIGCGVLLLCRAGRRMMSSRKSGGAPWRGDDMMGRGGLDRGGAEERGNGGRWRAVYQAAMLAGILTMVLLQAGRMNLAIDFDSLWYGVRSHVMLDSGNGIYENLGTLGVVYTYPKGLETLTLPLSGLPSYSFVTAFNIIAAGMALLAAFETAAVCVRKRNALLVPFLMAAVPGIMNMADTAKADMMTLFCQILMLQGVMRYLKENDGGELPGGESGCADGEGAALCGRGCVDEASAVLCGSGCADEEGAALQESGRLGAGWLALGLAAGGVSLTMKPTAVIFSTAIAGMSLFWLIGRWIGKRRRRGKLAAVSERSVPGERRKIANPERDMPGERYEAINPERSVPGERHETAGASRCWLAVLAAAAAGAGIWGRTLKLVGVPVTSVFYQVFQKMGFRVRYPFYAAGFPSAGSGMSASEKLEFLAGRLYGVLLNPQGDDMGHVIIAWGTVLPAVLVVLMVCFCGVKKGQEVCLDDRASREKQGGRQFTGYLAAVLSALLFIDLVSLYSLSQIDGNYYMLTYTVLILMCGIWLAECGGFCRKSAYMLLIPVWMYGAVLCGLTNWAWTLGNGGIQIVNRGYYPHAEIEREKRTAQGSGAIWEIFAANPRNRVIALGEHPGVLTFPCWVQSYVDVSGYWGNPDVVADAPAFLRYLQFAGVDYLYMEKEYVDTSVRIYQIVRTLVEQGWLYDVRDENGNLVLSVRRQDGGGAEAAEGMDRIGKEPAESGLTEEEIQRNLWVFDHRYIQHP